MNYFNVNCNLNIFFFHLNFKTFFPVSDDELSKKNYVIDQEQFDKRVREYVKIYNYTLDQDRLISAITFMYSPWNDPENKTLIRQGLIDVSCFSVIVFHPILYEILYFSFHQNS